MRLIDSDALLDEYCGDCHNISRQICGDDPICGVAMIIKYEPTVEDAVVVVRCKDCKFYKGAEVNERGFLVCPASGMEITDYDYCSYGERKEGAE